MALPESFLDELRARTPLGALIGRRVRLTRAGRELKGLCPFHNEKTPSFHVVEDKGFFHCFGCGAHGDAIGFVMRAENLGFMEAVERLAGEAGMAVPRASPEAAAAAERTASLSAIAEAAASAFVRRLHLPEGRPALEYLRRRGLTDETIRLFGLGWSGEGRGAIAADLRGDGVTVEQLVAVGLMKQEDDRPAIDLFFNRVMFPIRDRRGRVIGFGGRTLGDGQPKYLNGPETALFSKRRTLYGLDLARANARSGAELVVVEGYMDVIALHQAGFGGAVAPLGTALTADHLAELWRISEAPVVCFDGDSAGVRAALKTASLVLSNIQPGKSARFVTLPEHDDPDTFVSRAGATAFQKLLDEAPGVAETIFRNTVGDLAKSSPDERIIFRQKLEDIAASINDPVVRQEYRHYFRERWFSERRSDSRSVAPHARRPRPSARPDLSEERIRNDRERFVVRTAALNPDIIPELEAALENCDFLNSSFQKLATIFSERAEDFFGLGGAESVSLLKEIGAGLDIEMVLRPGAFWVKEPSVFAESRKELLADVLRVMGSLDQRALLSDLERAREAYAVDPSDFNLRRIVRLRAAMEPAAFDEEHDGASLG